MEPLSIEERPEGLMVRIRAHAGARKNGVLGIRDGALRVAVTQAPERGKANKAILDVLAKQLALKPAQLELIAGDTSPQKQVLVRGLTADELRAKVLAVVED